MAIIKSMVSSKTNEWATPSKLFNYLNKEFNFTLDPCCTHENAKCVKHYTMEDNGLSKSWYNEVVFINPPYGGHTKEWLEKVEKESHENNAVCVCLIVSATDRSYWHDNICQKSQEIRFMRGRVKFGTSKETAPFASALVIFTPKNTPCKVSFVDYREYHQGNLI